MKKTKSIEMATTPKCTHNLFTLKNLLPCKHKFASTFGWLRRKAVAFTMAEILLSLAVIGIIAAMTLPTLTANFQDRAFNAKRQALHARLAQAFRTIDYSEYLPINNSEYEYYDESEPDNDKWIRPNAEKFMDDLGKLLSIKRISDPYMIFNDSDDFREDLYRATQMNSGYNDIYATTVENDIYFQTANGESVRMFLMNPNTSDKNNMFDSLCFILLYDLNGKKGPNKFGKDMGFMSAFYYDHIELYASMLGAITRNMENDDYNPDDPNSQKYKYPDLMLPSPEELVNALLTPEEAVINSSFFCSSDGHTYEKGDGIRRQSDYSDCIYALITDDGTSPKNGIVIDME